MQIVDAGGNIVFGPVGEGVAGWGGGGVGSSEGVKPVPEPTSAVLIGAFGLACMSQGRKS